MDNVAATLAMASTSTPAIFCHRAAIAPRPTSGASASPERSRLAENRNATSVSVATRCGAILAAKRTHEFAGMRSRNLARGRFAAALCYRWTPPPEGGGGNHIDVDVAGHLSSPNIDGYRVYYGTSSGNTSQHADFLENRNACNRRGTSCWQYVLLYGSGVLKKS